VGYRGLKIAVPGTTGLKRHFPQENARLHDGGKNTKIVDRSKKLNLIAARFIVHGG
jgi:hypothetical protein